MEGFLIALALAVIGFFLAFDVHGMASSFYENNTGFTRLGRKLKESGGVRPNPVRIVGWVFLIVGAAVVAFGAVGVVVHFIRHSL
jgi:hypothetical protein